jgi:hypothetical protein
LQHALFTDDGVVKAVDVFRFRLRRAKFWALSAKAAAAKA